MHSEIKRLFNACRKDEEFIKMLKLADNDPKPSIWMSNDAQVIYAYYYYGWLIGKHGTNWREYI